MVLGGWALNYVNNFFIIPVSFEALNWDFGQQNYLTNIFLTKSQFEASAHASDFTE